MKFNIIVATCNKNGIGKDNKIPWFLRGDLKHFKKITTQVPEDPYYNYVNMVIMGRNTWESIPENRRPLENRVNVILTRNDLTFASILNKNITRTANSLDRAIELATMFNAANTTFDLSRTATNIVLGETSETSETSETREKREKNENVTMGNEDNTNNKVNRIYKIFIIGGERPYKEAIEHKNCDKIYITEVYKSYDCDTFFPNIRKVSNTYNIIKCSDFMKENDVYYRFIEYQNLNYIESETDMYRNLEEEKYLRLMQNIIDRGIERDDRTGVGTLSLFGQQLKYDLRNTFPLSTTKRMFTRAIFEELMLYLRGQTDNKILVKKGINIWNGNTSRSFLDKRGLSNFNEGDMGETYGFNFRHFGGEYNGCQHEYGSDVGFDQLAYVIDLLKNNPESRRIMINLWNPKTLHKAALPSCLCQYQFYVDTIRKELHLQIYLRSSDFFLANSWNACTGAFLVHLLCNLNGIDLTPGDLTVVTGDTHIYKSHIKQVKENLSRFPYPYPKLIVKSKKDNIEDFQWEDMLVVGYKCYPRIPAPMAV